MENRKYVGAGPCACPKNRVCRRQKQMYRKTWVEIDLDALTHNINVIKNLVGESVRVLVPVKADAYGHGIFEISSHLQNIGVDYLGVGTIDEAVLLRDAGITLPILFLGSPLPHEIPIACEYQIALTASSKQHLELFNRIALEKNTSLTVHLKIDTGMSRLGIWHEDIEQIIVNFSYYSSIIFEGVYTHFHSADAQDTLYTQEQLNKFNAVLDAIKSTKREPHFIHAANSMAMLNFSRTHFNLVRPGLIVYGLYPDKKSLCHAQCNVQPVLSLKSSVVLIKQVKQGQTISYARTYTADQDTLRQ